MSEEEKAQQIGTAVTTYQSAKAENGHMEKRVERVFKAYRDAARALDPSRSPGAEVRLDGEKIIVNYAELPIADLLNASELIELLRERDRTRDELKSALVSMQSLGVLGIS